MKYAVFLSYGVLTMKRPGFRDVLKISNFLQVLRVSCTLREFNFPPRFAGYLTGHS
jgi:hypothetical protein